jgi:Flp pilus assembly protein TadG
MNYTIKRNKLKERHWGQGMVEFGLALPVILFIVLGLIEASRLIFFWAMVTTASREGARYASTLLQFDDCTGIEGATLNPGQFVGMTAANVTISYDKGPGTSTYSTCSALNPTVVVLGDRVNVTATTTYTPGAGFVSPPFAPISITSTTSRTIAKEIQLWGEDDGGGGGGGGGSSNPTITITDPADGSVHQVGTSVIFEATAADNDDGVLTPSITWSSNRDGSLGSTGYLDLDTLSRDTHIITASVTDSDGNTATDSITVVINGAPTVTITAPANGATVSNTSNVLFKATATDIEAPTNLSNQVQWTSSLNGYLGQGNEVTHGSLNVGVHTITATVTDSGGLEGTATITLNVTSTGNTSPNITIISPPDNWEYPQYPAIIFSANANDVEDGGLGSSVDWTSSRDGFLWTGSTFGTASLSFGVHTITATVVDSGGLFATDSITLTVTSGSPAAPVYVNHTASPQSNKCVNVQLSWASPTGADAWSQYSLSYKVFLQGDSNPQAILPSNDPGNTTFPPPNFNHNTTRTYEVEAQFSGNFTSDRLVVQLRCDNGVLSIVP